MPLEEITHIDLAIASGNLSAALCEKLRTLNHPRLDNPTILDYLKYQKTDMETVLSLSEKEYERIAKSLVGRLIFTNHLTMEEAIKRNTRRAIILTSNLVLWMLSLSVLSPNRALILDNTFEFMDREPLLEAHTAHRCITPEEAIQLHQIFKDEPFYRKLYERSNLRAAGAFIEMVELHEKFRLQSILSKHHPEMLSRYFPYSPNKPLDLIPQTATQFAALNWAIQNTPIDRIRLETQTQRYDMVQKILKTQPGFNNLKTDDARFRRNVHDSNGHEQYMLGTFFKSRLCAPTKKVHDAIGHGNHKIGLFFLSIRQNDRYMEEMSQPLQCNSGSQHFNSEGSLA